MKLNQHLKHSLIGIFGLASTGIHAAGFYLVEVGTPASLGTAGVANPTQTLGADTSWTNPAAMTYIRDEHALAGLQAIVPKIEFNIDAANTTGGGDDGGNAGEVSAVPSFFYVKPLDERVSAGFSITGVMGGGYDYGSNFVGRYAVKEVEIAGLAMTPSIAYRVNNRLSLGAGISLLYTMMYQEIAINAPGPLPDGLAKFDDLDDIGIQGVFGLTYELTDKALLGVVYRTEADTDLEGKLKLEDAPWLPAAIPRKGDLKIEWTNPQWLEAGLRYAVNDKTHLYFNAGWQDWSAFAKNYITIGSNGVTQVLDRNWKDTWYAGLAVAYSPSPSSIVSFGASYDSSPVDDEDRTLDMALGELWKISAAYGWKMETFDLAIGATLHMFDDTPVDQTSQGVRVVGDYDTNSMLFVGGTLRYAF